VHYKFITSTCYSRFNKDSNIQRDLLEDQGPIEQRDDEHAAKDSESEEGRTLTSCTPIDPIQELQRGRRKRQVHFL
jgi:hypothetical protein